MSIFASYANTADNGDKLSTEICWKIIFAQSAVMKGSKPHLRRSVEDIILLIDRHFYLIPNTGVECLQDLGRQLLILADPEDRNYIPNTLIHDDLSEEIVSTNETDFDAQIFDGPDEKESKISALDLESLPPVCKNSGIECNRRHRFTDSTVLEISFISTPTNSIRSYFENLTDSSQKQDPSQFRNYNTTEENSELYDLSDDDTYKNASAEQSDLISFDLLNDCASQAWTKISVSEVSEQILGN
ncbi:hypothetical protein QAD02_021794 [Eretmocerus hayati]|uniref:Uncharacterized protein n=1 Tax=Eretmocerus hayati TaxID=131215 RepID=A0ACC2PR71_9HYME|nr:hypothetical protein QAD02_021794 [Eretmocerus hayati]